MRVYPGLIRLLLTIFVFSQAFFAKAQSDAHEKIIQAAAGLELRGIGPALMGGRIADIAVSSQHPGTWYVAMGSGGVWKTENRGTTWTAVFEDQPSYSIGTLALDPHQSGVVWVGTGENVSGRHVGWGDGVYRSADGGKTWKRMGLEQSEHIGRILVDPRDSQVIFAAAEGPLWASGGDRGLYKSTDGGNSWEHVLEIDAHTGVTDVEFDPSNPDVMYAAAYQRRRKVWSLLAGGPSSGIYKSEDGGDTWRRLRTGLPQGDMGKIGLAVTPADPDRVYATIEAAEGEKGFYRSDDKGESWVKQNDYISGGTGPHYYQEIEASPRDPDLVYQMDVFLHLTRDGGQTFDYLGTGREKHSDNHALWIDPENGDHLLAGTDAGLYESFDQGTTWRHFPNLPVSQFYKLALDSSLPFYNIVGGAQDLGTLIGPSRTMNIEGIRNRDWYVPLGADGYDAAFDPTDPATVYMEIQQGELYRYDKKSEEVISIQPQAGPNDPPERWNWDSPILVSPHNPNRLYFGSQRVWRSEDQGDSWIPVSPDLTTNVNRYELEMMGRVWSVDALHDTGAMSKYATLTGLSESPLSEGLLYAASDDGLVHVSEDGGAAWRKTARLPGIPSRAFMADVEASAHDANTVFVAVDAHKTGDFSPYLFVSKDRGRTWRSIAGDLPEGTLVWAVKQDAENPEILFLGTEFGLYFSYDSGTHWVKLEGGVPTIPFRDIELHPRDGDLVGASFGRGFYVLDDYSPLRTLAGVAASGENALFPVRDAWWYIPNVPMQAKGMPTLGSSSFVANNPPFGAVFTYYLHEVPETAQRLRRKEEKTLRARASDIPFPGWDTMEAEQLEQEPAVLVLIKDAADRAVRWIQAPAREGLSRTNWDLRWPAVDPIDLSQPDFQPPWVGDPKGPLAAPGSYTASLYLLVQGVLIPQGKPQSFEVRPVPGAGYEADYGAVAAFQQETAALSREVSAAGDRLAEVQKAFPYMQEALKRTPAAPGALFSRLETLRADLASLKKRLRGHPERLRMNEAITPSIAGRVSEVVYGHWDTRQTPTKTQQLNIALAAKAFETFRADLKAYLNRVSEFEAALEQAGAPYTPGRRLD